MAIVFGITSPKTTISAVMTRSPPTRRARRRPRAGRWSDGRGADGDELAAEQHGADQPPLVAMRRVTSSARLSPAGLQRLHARARSCGQRGLRAGEERRGDKAKNDDERGYGQGHGGSLTARVGRKRGSGPSDAQFLAKGEAQQVTRHDVLEPFEVFGARRTPARCSARPRRRRAGPRRPRTRSSPQRRRTSLAACAGSACKVAADICWRRRWRRAPRRGKRVRSCGSHSVSRLIGDASEALLASEHRSARRRCPARSSGRSAPRATAGRRSRAWRHPLPHRRAPTASRLPPSTR